MAKKLAPELARAIACSAGQVETSVWGDGSACSTVKHIACGKTHTTRIYRKRATAERNADRWLQQHFETCKVFIEANEAFQKAQDALAPRARQWKGRVE